MHHDPKTDCYKKKKRDTLPTYKPVVDVIL